MSLLKRWFLSFGFGAALAGSGWANELETCEYLSGVNDPFLCTTALEFGGQAAVIRDSLMALHGGLTFPTAAQTETVSTRGGNTPYSGRAMVAAQATFGSFTGNNQYLILGADRPSGRGLIGLMVLAGNSSITPPASPVVTRQEVLFGPYFSTQLNNGDYLDGYLLYGRPNYTVANVPSQGESTTAALTWSRVMERDGFMVVPLAGLSVKRERPTGSSRIDATVLTLGTTAQQTPVRTSNGYRMNFGRLELDIGHYADSFGNSISYVAPRVAFGANFAQDNGAVFGVTVGLTAASDKTAILNAQAMYRFEF